jgi:hypothetical protein
MTRVAETCNKRAKIFPNRDRRFNSLVRVQYRHNFFYSHLQAYTVFFCVKKFETRSWENRYFPSLVYQLFSQFRIFLNRPNPSWFKLQLSTERVKINLKRQTDRFSSFVSTLASGICVGGTGITKTERTKPLRAVPRHSVKLIETCFVTF